MDNKKQLALDEKGIILNKMLGFSLVALGIFGIIIAFKTYKQV
jgi:hypothetical protein